MPVPADWRERVRKCVDEYKRSPDRFGPKYDDLFNSFVWMEPESAASLESFRAWLRELDGSWGFRGQRESEWTLQTSFDREIRVFHDRGHYPLDRQTEENELLFRFQQQVHNYVHHLPSVDDRAGWLALMQHYGVPTRLMDWTQSPYVALYFAVEEKPRGLETNRHGGNDHEKTPKGERCSAVWAIDLNWLAEKEQAAIASPAARRGTGIECPDLGELPVDDPVHSAAQIRAQRRAHGPAQRGDVIEQGEAL